MADSLRPSTGASYDEQIIADKIDAANDIEEYLDALEAADRLRSNTAALAGDEPVMATQSIGGTPQQSQRTRKRSDSHDEKLVNSDDIDQDVGKSPAGKRLRREPESSDPWPNAANRPQLPSTAFAVPNAHLPTSQPNQADPASSKVPRSTLPVFTETPRSRPVNEISRWDQLSRWLDDGRAASASGGNLRSFSTLQDPALQRDTASVNGPIVTGGDSLAGLSQVFGSDRRPTPYQQFDPQLPFANQQNGPQLSSINQQIVRQTSRQTAQQTAQKTVQQPQHFQRPPPRRRKFHGQNEVKSFPSSRESLPANLSLEQICWNYPNHIQGSVLRPFIEAGWTATMIWNAMQESAKVTSAKTRPWNKLEHKLLNEKKRMANDETADDEEEDNEEEDTGPGGEKTPGNSSITREMQDMEESREPFPPFSLAAEQEPGTGDVVGASAPEAHDIQASSSALPLINQNPRHPISGLTSENSQALNEHRQNYAQPFNDDSGFLAGFVPAHARPRSEQLPRTEEEREISVQQ
jgi:hypothetical protein